MKHLFVKTVSIPRSADEVFAWHERPYALQKLIPPGNPVCIIGHVPGVQGPVGDGARVVLQIGRWPLTTRWVAVHEGYIPGRQFIDVQRQGPFAFWRHTHSVLPTSERSCVLKDQVEYTLPLSPWSDLFARYLVRSQIEKMFAWRHAVTLQELNKDQ